MAKAFDESAVLQRLQQGDQDALAELVTHLTPKANGWLKCRFVSFNDDDRNQVLFDALLKVWNKRAEYKSTKPFVPWFFRILNNTAIDYLRTLMRRCSRELPFDESSAVSPLSFDDPKLDDPSELTKRQSLIGGLSPEDQSIIRNNAQYDAELAIELGITVNNLRVRRSRILRTLRAKTDHSSEQA